MGCKGEDIVPLCELDSEGFRKSGLKQFRYFFQLGSGEHPESTFNDCRMDFARYLDHVDQTISSTRAWKQTANIRTE